MTRVSASSTTTRSKSVSSQARSLVNTPEKRGKTCRASGVGFTSGAVSRTSQRRAASRARAPGLMSAVTMASRGALLPLASSDLPRTSAPGTSAVPVAEHGDERLPHRELSFTVGRHAPEQRTRQHEKPWIRSRTPTERCAELAPPRRLGWSLSRDLAKTISEVREVCSHVAASQSRVLTPKPRVTRSTPVISRPSKPPL